MARNRSLDEFVPEEGGEETASPGNGGQSATDSAGREAADGDRADADSEMKSTDVERSFNDENDGTADESVDPLTVTYEWAPSGAPCADCGTVVERRWVDEGARLCVDCKSW